MKTEIRKPMAPELLPPSLSADEMQDWRGGRLLHFFGFENDQTAQRAYDLMRRSGSDVSELDLGVGRSSFLYKPTHEGKRWVKVQIDGDTITVL